MVKNLCKELTLYAKKYPIKSIHNSLFQQRKINKELFIKYDFLGMGAYRKVIKMFDDNGNPVAVKLISEIRSNPSAKIHNNTNFYEWNMYKWLKNNRKNVSKFVLKPIKLLKTYNHQFLIVPLIVNKNNFTIKGWNKKVIEKFHECLPDTYYHNWTIVNGIPVVYDWNMWEKCDITKEVDSEFKNLLKQK